MKRDLSGLSRNFVDPAAGLFSKVRVILWGKLVSLSLQPWAGLFSLSLFNSHCRA